MIDDPRLPQRFWDKVVPEPNTGCWLWTASQQDLGYGYYSHEKRLQNAHRVSYKVLTGSIPAGLELDHKCRTPSCVNPDHLEAVTHAVNLQRRLPFRNAGGDHHRAKTHCPHGHLYSGANLYTAPASEGRQRQCKACNRDANRRYRARKAGL